MTAANALSREPLSVALDRILGVSPLNPRRPDFEDIDGLAASIRASGQLQPLLVTRTPAPLDGYAVLDGQRRWRAMQLLVEQGHWAADSLVDVDVATGDEAALREIALAANTLRRQLHPVEEYEAFVAMAQAGYGEERIAKDFGLGLRHVRQRLALGRLSPKILAAWREGRINADVAQAFTAGATHEAQDAVFEQLGSGLYENAIKSRLRADTLSGQSKEALYVGAEAYLAAGGRIDEDLFADDVTFRDGSLLKRLAREKLMAEAEPIAEREGWGFILHSDERADGDYLYEDDDLDYLPEERRRLGWIHAEIASQDDDSQQKLEDERHAIVNRACLRTVPKAQRASLGLVVALIYDGTVVFNRGWKADNADEDAGDVAASDPAPRVGPRAAEKGAAAEISPAPTAPAERNGKALRAVLDEAANKAFHDCIIGRPDLAFMVAVAQLATGFGDDSIKLSGHRNHAFEIQSELLAKLDRLTFEKALTVCANAPLADLTAAFTEIVALSINVMNPGYSDAPLSNRVPLARALAARGARLHVAFDEALDREAYFSAATKQACLAVVDEIGTPAINRTDKKSLIASYVAADAEKKHWLPAPLSDWTKLKATSPERPRDEDEQKPLAQAMVEAIDADKAQREAKIYAVCDLKHGAPQFAKFLISHIRFAEDLICKASDLREVYIAISSSTSPLTPAAIGNALADLGVAKTRKKDGIYYRGIDLIGTSKSEAA